MAARLAASRSAPFPAVSSDRGSQYVVTIRVRWQPFRGTPFAGRAPLESNELARDAGFRSGNLDANPRKLLQTVATRVPLAARIHFLNSLRS